MQQVMGRKVYDPTSQITVPEINKAIAGIKQTINSHKEFDITRDSDVLKHLLKDFENLKKDKLAGKRVTDWDFFNFSLKSHEIATQLIELGEDLSDDWEVIDERRCDEITITENTLNTVFQFAQAPKTTSKNSEQDTSLFKIRYKYTGESTGQREFCNKVLAANKIYRAEDLNFNSVYNEDFAPEGSTSYNVFLHKGGTNCRHWWSRVIMLRKDNTRLSVNDARKMILKLEPEDRKDAKWEQNPKEVAQVAGENNNWWSLKPNYRKSGINPIKK